MRLLERVVTALAFNTEDARTAYKEEYGIAHNDPSIDRELEALFDDAMSFDPPRTKANVPLHLLLAVMLRRRKRGAPKKLTFYVRRKGSGRSCGGQRSILLADLRKELRQRRPDETATDALWRVAEEGINKFEELFGWKPSIDTMKSWLDHPPRRRR